jgi:predicted Zn finger-like uncharacterized protein
MTNMIISCPSCPQKLRVPEDLLGRPVKCPKCGIIFDAPPPEAAAEPTQDWAGEAAAPSQPGVPPQGNPVVPAPGTPPARRIRRDAEPGRGALILTLGIVSIVLPIIGWVPGIAAIVMGRSDQRKIRSGSMDRSAADTTQAGWICGIIGTVIQLLVCLACGVYMTAIAAFVASAKNNPNFGRPPVIQGAPAGPQVPFPPPPDQPKK